MGHNSSNIFAASSQVGRLAAVASFLTLIAFFTGPFYWPGSNAGWATFLRISVLISAGLYLFNGVSIRRPKSLEVMVLIFFSYLLLNAVILGEDMQSARRLIFIAVFVFMVSRFWTEPALPRILLCFVTLMGACFAVFSLINLDRLNQLDLSYRGVETFSSGEPGIADFGNTIIAAMHYAFCYCSAFWLLLKSKIRYMSFLWMLCLGVVGFYIIFTFARTGWMVCLIASFGLLILAVRGNAWRRAVPVVLVLLGLLAWFAYKYIGYELHVRGLTSRGDIWLEVLSRVESDFWWGFGGGAKMDPIPLNEIQLFVYTAHSTYLEVLYQFGAVGLSLMLVLLFMAIKDLWLSAFRKRDLGADAFGLVVLGPAAVVMIVELSGLVDSPNLLWIWFWLPLGIALSQARGNDAEYKI